MAKDEERRVAAWYDALSKGYDELYGPEQSLKERRVLEFVRGRRFPLLIDVGCGSASLLRDAAPIYDFAIGVDLSIKMLNEAKKKKSPNSDVVLATSRMLPIRDGLVDCVVSISTFKIDSNLPQVQNELRRICSRNATLAISLFQNPVNESPFGPPDVVRSSKMSDHESLYFMELKGHVKQANKSRTIG